MTWTQINPDKFSQYEGITPADIGRSMISNADTYTESFFLKQDGMFSHHSNTDPYNYVIDNKAWSDFWKPVYDLKNKSKKDWTLDDWFGYRALDHLINYALARV